MIPKPAKGICTTVLLLLIIILALASIPSATSQQFTTSTSFITGTSYATLFSYVTSAGVGMQTQTLSFSWLAGCGELAVGTGFEASGVTQLEYSANGPMEMYLVDAATLQQWSSGPLGWIACAPSSGNWVRYPLGTGYDSLPLSGTIGLNLPANTYYIVCIASSGSPTTTVVVGPVQIPQTETMPYSVPTTYTVSSLVVSEVPVFSISPILIVILLWAVAIVVAVIVLVYFLRRSKGKGKATQMKLDSVLTQKPSALPESITQIPIASPKPKPEAPALDMFCNQCGARITRDSKFCKECGAGQIQ